MKNRTCCFTGHRNIPADKYADIQKQLDSYVLTLINEGAVTFITGGARGFDTMAALTILRIKKMCSHIRLSLILPCKNQTKGWAQSDIKTYNRILKKADEVIYTSERYYPGCMHVRNRRMVDESCVCVCFLTNTNSGTAYTTRYARQKRVYVINLA